MASDSPVDRIDEQPRPPREATAAAGEATNAGQVRAPAPEGDSSPARPGQVCECQHLDVLHAFARDNRTRTACSVTTGAKATRCGCRRFEPLNQENPS